MEGLNFRIPNHILEVEAAILLLENFPFVCLMGNGDDIKNIRTSEMEKLSMDTSTNRFSRDLLQSFIGITNEYEPVTEDGDEIELNLGLSLGGRFGVDKTPTKLVRSSSIASCLPVERDDNDAVAPPAAAYAGLVRTSSLPVESEDEWRKRKELQTLRRMEAKRRRSEKLRSSKGDIQGGGSGNLSFGERKEIEMNLRGRMEREKLVAGVKRLSSSVGTQFKPSMWASQAILGERFDAAMAKGKGNYAGGFGGLQGFGKMMSQGSVESKGGSSSSLSDLESKTRQGSSRELSPASTLSLQDRSNQEVGSSVSKTRENQNETIGAMIQNPANKSDSSRSRGKEIRTNAIEDMPCVFTAGDGPNGRRVDGILYKYGRGEEVRIMCVCHGNFHSPAEFVMHAGGTDVDHPLKHIVINPNSTSQL